MINGVVIWTEKKETVKTAGGSEQKQKQKQEIQNKILDGCVCTLLPTKHKKS